MNDPKPTPPGGSELEAALAKFNEDETHDVGAAYIEGGPCSATITAGLCVVHGRSCLKDRGAAPVPHVVLALPVEAAKRKAIPLVSGCLDYFPAALAAVAELSRIGNEQHNKGQPMHHARGKSSDHADCLMRHLMDRGVVDTDGVRHSAKVAWRALALLQEELEREAGAPLARGARAG